MPTRHSTKNTKKIIVSFASKGREDYNKGQERLHESILKHWDSHFYLHSLEIDGELPATKRLGYKTHQQIPYYFKLLMIDRALEMGYEEIYWLDSSLVLERDITGLANPIMAFHNLGHPLKNYISDEAVKNLDCANELDIIQQTWGGAIGFNFKYTLAHTIFDELIRQAQIGSFNEGTSSRPGFVNHRHDQAVLSVLLNRYNVPLIPYGAIVTHPHYLPPYEYGESFFISHRPIQ